MISVFGAVPVGDGDRPVFRSAASFPASRSPIPRSRTCCPPPERVGGSRTLSRCTGERARSPAAARHPDVTVVVAPPPFTRGGTSRTDRSMRHVARGSHPRSATTPGTVLATCDGVRPRLPPRPTSHEQLLRVSGIAPPLAARLPRVALLFRVIFRAPALWNDQQRGTAFPLSRCSRSGYRPVPKPVHREVPAYSGWIPAGGHVT